jgi:hypothetical protein
VNPEREVRRQEGAKAKQRATDAEALVIQALKDMPPSWVRKVRRGTADEDKRGIDIVVETADVGPLHLQVKSGRNASRTASKFRRSHLYIPVIIVKRGDLLLWTHAREKLFQARCIALRLIELGKRKA